jgi:prepilin-type N-terminal cleavage/methylation domain-containing protein
MRRSGQWSLVSGQLRQERRARIPTTNHQAPTTAFTLIELMISLAIMVMLMLGVNMIFSSVGRATGAASASSKIVRDAQAAQTIMNGDMQGIVVTESQLPFLIIQNETIQAFRSRQEELSSPDTNVPPNPMVDDDPQGTGTITYSYATYNNRNHRSDRLKFFARGLFPRQTGNDGVYVDDMSSSEAQITYGHLKLYSGSGTLTSTFPDPGSGTFTTNSSNYYAAQWVLGRSVMLLVPPDTSGKIKDGTGTSQEYFDYNTGTIAFSPLRVGVKDTKNKWLVQSSRYDLAGTSIQDERAKIKLWYDTPANVGANNPPPWWDAHTYRFWGNPLFLRPLSSESASQTTPLFLSNCTQFMVEYAGDYLSQDKDGKILDVCGYVKGTIDPPPTGKGLTTVTGEYKAGITDGETDFIILPNGQRRIRWYGLPRDLDGDGRILTRQSDPNLMVDVLPLRDLIYNKFPDATAAAMERKVPQFPGGNDYAAVTGGLAASELYAAIWGPSGSYGYLPSTDPSNPNPVPIKAPPLPRLIRIIVTLDDPNGRLNEGQTFEYVFRLQ